MINKFLELSIGYKIIILAVPMIILGTVAGAMVSNNQENEGYVFEIPDANSVVENVIIENDLIENEILIENGYLDIGLHDTMKDLIVNSMFVLF